MKFKTKWPQFAVTWRSKVGSGYIIYSTSITVLALPQHALCEGQAASWHSLLQ